MCLITPSFISSLLSLKNISTTLNKYFYVKTSPNILATSCKLSLKVILILLSFDFNNFSYTRQRSDSHFSRPTASNTAGKL